MKKTLLILFVFNAFLAWGEIIQGFNLNDCINTCKIREGKDCNNLNCKCIMDCTNKYNECLVDCVKSGSKTCNIQCK